MLILMGAFRDRTEDNVEDLMRGMEDIIAAMNAETDHADPLDAIVADHAYVSYPFPLPFSCAFLCGGGC